MKEKIKLVIIFIAGIIISTVISVYAATVIAASEVSYTSNSNTIVQTGLDNLYTKANTMANTLTDLKTNKIKYVANNSGNGKTVSSTSPVYLGTNVTIPSGYHGLVIARRGYNSGAPTGVYIRTSSTSSATSYIQVAYVPSGFITNGNIGITVSRFLGPGTYYLWSSGATGYSSETMYAILIKN